MQPPAPGLRIGETEVFLGGNQDLLLVSVHGGMPVADDLVGMVICTRIQCRNSQQLGSAPWVVRERAVRGAEAGRLRRSCGDEANNPQIRHLGPWILGQTVAASKSQSIRRTAASNTFLKGSQDGPTTWDIQLHGTAALRG